MSEDRKEVVRQMEMERRRREVAKMEAARVESSAQKELTNPQTGMRAALDATASVASGAVAAPVSGLAGIAGAVLPGPQGQGADWQQRTQQALTHQPSTPGSQEIVDTATAPFTALANQADKAGGAVTDALGPAAGAVVNTAIQAVPMAIGRGVKATRPLISKVMTRAAADAAANATRGSVKTNTWERAKAEGYVVPSSEIAPSTVGKIAETVGGKAAVKQEAIVRNQQITDKIARREAGLGPDEQIDESTLEAARKKMAAPYDELASVSPRAAAALEKFKQAKFNAKEQWSFYNRTGNPDARKLAESFDKEADTADKLMTMHAKRAGKPDLVDRIAVARKQLAKNYEVERALNVGTGSVDAQYFAREINKHGVDRYSEGLQTIGLFAKAFGNYSKDSSRLYMPGVSHLDAVGSAVAVVSGHPIAGGLPLLRGPARSLALRAGGEPYQPSVGLRLSSALANNPLASDPSTIIQMSLEQRRQLGLQ
jgi:hypothetical protein